MGANESNIPEKTIELMARGFFRESLEYGFKKVDYLRFVNHLLDIALKNSETVAGHPNHIPVSKSRKKHVTQEMPLVGDHIAVRKFEKQDAQLLKKWVKDEEGRHFLLSRSSSEPLDIDHLHRDKGVIAGIITLPDETPIGLMLYCSVCVEHKRAEIRKLIGERTMRRKGYAKEATRLWIDYGLHALNLHKIYLSTLNTNIRNIRLNEKLGFEVEGILRNEVFFDGEYHDVLRMGLYKNESDSE